MKQKLSILVLILIVVAVAAAQSIFYGPRTVDDLFISLRYADNLLAGHGLVYNPGEPPVEGFSNPIWVALQALVMWVGVEGVTATKLLSGVSLVGLLGATWAAGRELLGLSSSSAWLAVAAVALNSYVVSWAWLGLETPLYLALMLGYAAALHARMGQADAERSVWGALGVGGLAFGLLACRPEGGLFVLAIGVALLAEASDGAEARSRFMAAVPPAVVAGLGFVAALLARLTYYGKWAPHTYDSKQGAGFGLEKLEPLWGQGATPPELAAVVLAGGLAVWLGVRERRWVPLAMASATALFVAGVEVDWMPNQRHMLPLWLAAALCLAWGADPLAQWALEGEEAERRWLWVGGLSLAALIGCGAAQAAIDSRFSIFDFRTHGRGEAWVRWKGAQTWEDAWRGVRRVVPEHARTRYIHHHGMIKQLYRVIEHSDAPEAESWYVGRDIGRVGYYSPIRIFDTPGLFTPNAIPPRGEGVTLPMVGAALLPRPVVAELDTPWARIAGRDPSLTRPWEVTAGKRSMPWRLELREGGTPPTAPQLLARYDRVAGRLPTGFYMATLYGESVGALMEARGHWAHMQFEGLEGGFVMEEAPAASPEWRGRGGVLDGVVRLHGCRVQVLDPGGELEAGADVMPGGLARLECAWSARRRLRRAYTVFAHVMVGDERRMQLDHPPAQGVMPTWRWPEGAIVRDVATFPIPEALAGQEVEVRVGLFEGEHRARVAPERAADAQGRVRGPTLRVGGGR